MSIACYLYSILGYIGYKMSLKSLNLGIVAHVDAGKTSLTERLLFDNGIINKLGNVDAGDTRTDTHAIEKQRGITIQSAVVSFMLNDTIVNLIDTPGHSDFISEVERAFAVLDAVILVISAVEGIQSQTRVLMKTISKMKLPALIFINKIDRAGADFHGVFEKINTTLNINALAMVDVQLNDENKLELITTSVRLHKQIMETLSENNETFLTLCLKQNFAMPWQHCQQEIAQQCANNMLVPVFSGSAVRGIGIAPLIDAISELLPTRNNNSHANLQAQVFKIERDKQGNKVSYLNITDGTLHNKNLLKFSRQDHDGFILEKASSLKIFANGTLEKTQVVNAGTIAQVFGLKQIKIGDYIGKDNNNSIQFARPNLHTEIKATNHEDDIKLFKALQQLAECDPLIHAHRDPIRRQIMLSLYGEVQKQVIAEQLRQDYKIVVQFSESKIICVERPKHVGQAIHIMDLHNTPLEFYATLGFKIEPGPLNSGIQYHLGVELGSLPKGYHSVVKESVLQYLASGLHGWQVTDCIVTLTHTGLCPLSQSPHFRNLTPILMQEALEKAGTIVCEPFCEFELEIPQESFNAVTKKLSECHALIKSNINLSTTNHFQLTGTIPTRHIYEFEKNLPSLTQGEGHLICTPAGYIKV